MHPSVKRPSPIPTALLLLLSCSPLVADEPMGEQVRVKMKSGEFLQGRAFDLRNELLEVHQSPGSTEVLKRDVERWMPVSGSDRHRGQTLVLLTNGRELTGKVVREGSGWRIDLEVGTTRYTDAEVSRVVHTDGTCSDGSFTPRTGFEGMVDEAIQQVRSASGGDQKTGARQLERFGFFALPSISKAMEESDPGGRLRRIYIHQRFQVTMPAGVDEDFPDLTKTLTSGSEEERLSVLREAFLERGAEIFPLLVVLLLDPDQPVTVRALAVDVLQRMNRVEELVEAYNEATGATQIAVAVALGDGGIYVGIPTLLEALDMENLQVRALAAKKLSEYSGEVPGYSADGPENERRTAKSRWQQWWRLNQDRIEQTLAYRLSPEHRAKNPQRAKAVQMWREALRMREDGDRNASRELFIRAAEEDPTYLPPLVSLGIFYYTEDGNFDAAIECFRKTLRRGSEIDDPQILRLAYFHLGRIYQRGLDHELAARSYRKAVEIDENFADAWYNLGLCYYDEALSREGTRDERLGRFEAAARAFESGLKNLKEYREGLVVVTHEQMPFGSDLPFSRREYNMTLLKLRRRLANLEARFAYRLALVRVAVGQNDTALVAAQDSIKGPDPRADHHLLLARILEGMGRTVEAEEQKRKARALGPPEVRN